MHSECFDALYFKYFDALYLKYKAYIYQSDAYKCNLHLMISGSRDPGIDHPIPDGIPGSEKVRDLRPLVLMLGELWAENIPLFWFNNARLPILFYGVNMFSA